VKRTEVKTFLTAGINALSAGIAYSTGRISEFNSERMLSYPHTHLSPLEVTTTITDSGLPYDDWSVQLMIGKKDEADSSPDQYEAIVDECDEIAQELIKQYNDIVSGYKTVTLSGINRKPFIKKNADRITGVELSFTIKAPDTSNWC
jgi:hypothetical protein